MAATTLNVYDYLATLDPSAYKEVIPSLVAILKQVIEHCLPADFDWKEVPAPWIQIKLLRLLCKLGKGDRKGSEHMYQVIGATLQLANNEKDCGRAIKYEAIVTIARIYPNGTQIFLYPSAAQCLCRFRCSLAASDRRSGILYL